MKGCILGAIASLALSMNAQAKIDAVGAQDEAGKTPVATEADNQKRPTTAELRSEQTLSGFNVEVAQCFDCGAKTRFSMCDVGSSKQILPTGSRDQCDPVAPSIRAQAESNRSVE